MGILLRFVAIFKVTLKRMYTQRGLVLANFLGLVCAIALTMSIPIYADSIYQSILEKEITPGNSGEETAAARPSFAFMYRYIGSWAGPIEWDKIKQANDYLSQQVPVDLGLKSKQFVRYLKTDQLMLFAGGKDEYQKSVLPLDFLYMATLTSQEKHITLSEGSLPKPAVSGSDEPIEVLMQEDRANELGAQSGEIFTLLAVLGTGTQKERVEIPIKIAGVWRASDPKDHYWFYSGSEFNSVLLVPEETLLNRVLPAIKNQLGLAVWYWVLDPSTVQSSKVPGLINRIQMTRKRATGYLPKIRLDISPEDALYQYQKAAQSLIIYLYSFSVPLLVMILVFVSLVMNMVVGQRRNEIAVLRSRGSTIFQLAGMSALESLVLVVFGLLVGAYSGELIAQLLGKARSFLDFSSQAVVHTEITPIALRFGLIAGLIAVAAQVLPTLEAAQNTIVNYKRDRARSVRVVWWKRFYLDIALLVPALYGIYLLRKGGAGMPNDPFQNPLLLLIPALATFAITLLILRILPLAMTAVAWIAGHTRSVGIMMAARTLARTSGGYSAPLILLAMTLSLSTFTATMAQTLDHDTYDHAYYQVGSDIRIKFIPEVGAGMAAVSQANSGNTGNEWVLVPISDHLSLPGVQAAARVLRTTVQMSMGGQIQTMNFVGIDRSDFQQTAFWRGDFAPQPLGALMNALAAMPEGVLVSRDLMQSQGFRVGDGLFINLYEGGSTSQTPFQIVGVFDYFPGWYPSDGPLIVGSLDYVFDQIGSEVPYDVWIKTAPGADPNQVLQAEENMFRTVLHTTVAPEMIAAQQIKPERQGFFGLLSVGFSALAIMSVVGFLLYALFSFRQRFVELGMLRAIGLSTGQMLMLLASELAFLFITGLATGTGLGAWISDMFIPYLQIGSETASRVPPFLVQINWLAVYQIYALFGGLFVVALVVLTVMLMRMKIFQAIKLGEVV